MSGQVWIVDVCGTLVLEDTTLGLLRHHFGKGARGLTLACTTHRASPLRLAFQVAERLTGAHLLKHFVLRLLAGESPEALERSGVIYADRLLADRRLLRVWEVLERRPSGSRLILASASLSPVVAALAARLDAEYVANKLEVRAGALTGRLAGDISGRKLEVLLEHFGVDLLSGAASCITDNASDKPLLCACSGRFVVLHHQRHRSRWGDLAATYIQV